MIVLTVTRVSPSFNGGAIAFVLVTRFNADVLLNEYVIRDIQVLFTMERTRS